MHALDSASPDSLGASPSLSDWPSAAYGVNASRDTAAWAEDGGAGRPTAGVLTAVTGPLDAPAVQADRQQIRRKGIYRARIFHFLRTVRGSRVPQRRQRAGPGGAQRRIRAGQEADHAADQRRGQGVGRV